MEPENTLPNDIPTTRPASRLHFWILVLVVMALLFTNLFLIRAPKEFPVDQVFTIEDGDTLRRISYNLQDAGYVRSRVAFETFVIIFGGEKRLKTGDYVFADRLSVVNLAQKIARGNRELGTVKITIPEGFNNKQIADVAAIKLKNFDKDKFIDLAKNKEGYLFPDTYFFSTSDNEEDVIDLLSKNFDKKIAQLMPEIESSKHSLDDIIIMASILEEEASGKGDAHIISGILWKRIRIGMALQVDAAPVTYKERGLPEAPISNPGFATIDAALHPEESKYLYYLHDRNGDTYYAADFDQHRQNIKKYLR